MQNTLKFTHIRMSHASEKLYLSIPEGLVMTFKIMATLCNTVNYA